MEKRSALMVHGYHTHDRHAWHESLTQGERRGLAARQRFFGVDPDGYLRAGAVPIPPSESSTIPTPRAGAT